MPFIVYLQQEKKNRNNFTTNFYEMCMLNISRASLLPSTSMHSSCSSTLQTLCRLNLTQRCYLRGGYLILPDTTTSSRVQSTTNFLQISASLAWILRHRSLIRPSFMKHFLLIEKEKFHQELLTSPSQDVANFPGGLSLLYCIIKPMTYPFPQSYVIIVAQMNTNEKHNKSHFAGYMILA